MLFLLMSDQQDDPSTTTCMQILQLPIVLPDGDYTIHNCHGQYGLIDEVTEKWFRSLQFTWTGLLFAQARLRSPHLFRYHRIARRYICDRQGELAVSQLP